MNLFRKHFAIILPLILVVFLIVPLTASAGLADTLLTDFVTGVFRFVAFIFNFIAGVLLAVAGFLTDLMLKLNLEVLDDTNTLVHVGWRLVRDIANLGFVLVIIVIAFATILRREQYGVTKLLPKLIAAAIIVNFSFAIAAVFINFSNVLTNFFFTKIPGAGGGISVHLADAFGPQRLLIETEPLPPNPEEDVGGLTGISTAVLVSITGLIFTVVFTLIAAFVLLAFAFMLLLRYLYLTFLVILAPLVWLFWVIPALAGQFNKWWNKFIQWIFFAPAVAFFIYLALISAEGLSKATFEFSPGGFFGIGSILKNVVIQGAQMVVLAGILIGGLIIAQKMGIVGAAGAMGMATTVGKGARAWAGRQAARGASYPLRTGTGRALTERLQTTGERLGGLGRFMTAPLRQAGRGLSTLRSKSEEVATKGVAESVRKRSIEENRRRFAAASNAEKVEIVANFSLQARSNNPQIRQVALEALSSIPQDALTKEVRLSFLYGRGGEAGTPYGPRIPFREPRIMERARPETRPRPGIGAQVEEMIETEAARRAAPPGGAPPAPGGGAPGRAP